MSVSPEVWRAVRDRASGTCEYCGVTDAASGGLLTVDHFQPQACGGTDDPGNLLYCCWRCNLYKAAYWPAMPGAPMLWNPRTEPFATHCVLLADGRLHGVSATGAFTIDRLRLNREALIEFRRARLLQTAELSMLEQYREVVTALEHLQRQHTLLLNEHRALLEEQRRLLKLLVERHGGVQ